MSPTVEEIGGMSRDAIELRILRGMQETTAMIEHAVKPIKDEINARFDKRDAMVEKRFDTIEDALKQSAENTAEIGKQVALIGQSVANLNDRTVGFHQDEIAYREKLAGELEKTKSQLQTTAEDIKLLKPEVASIRKHQEEAKKSLQRMSWLFDILKVFGNVARAAVGKNEDDKKNVPALIAACGSTFITLWILLHQILPKIHYYLIEGHRFSIWGF